MSDASSPQVRDHETREGRERADLRGSEMAVGVRRRHWLANERERDDPGLARRGMAGGKGPSRGGRRSNEPTSRRATGWSLPALLRVSSFSSAAAYQECLALLGFSLFSFLGVAPQPGSRPAVLLPLILFIFPRSYSSTMWFDDLRSRRSSLCLLPYGGPATGRDASRNCSTVLHRRPTCCFGISYGNPGRFFCRALL